MEGSRRAARIAKQAAANVARERTQAHPSTPPRLAPDRPLDAASLQDLQRTVGNRAATAVVQRSGPQRYPRAKRPTKGADVRAALREQLPGLLTALTQDQLDHWQKIVDYYAVTRYVNGELAEQMDDYRTQYPGMADHWEGDGQFAAGRHRLEHALPPYPGNEQLAVDPALLLSDDVKAEPEWDKAAEKAWRDWALADLAKNRPTFDLHPDHDDEIISRRTWVGTYTTKGVITLADLRHRYREQYTQMVTDREDWRKLRQAYADTLHSFTEATDLHRERSEINRRNRGAFGIDIARNIIEFAGHGNQNYPAMAMWDEPRKMLDQIPGLLDHRKFEWALPVVAMAEVSTAQCADKIFAYDERVESGAAFSVKWLGRVKTVGSVAAGIAAAPLGMTGAALVAGGYTLVQEGGQNAMAHHLGQRADWGLLDAVKQAGVATVMGMMGGALQARFQAAMSARLLSITGTSGGAIRAMGVSAAAAGTSAVYTAAVEAALNSIVNGKALPANATELADLIVDHALQATAMDVGLHGVNARVAREYASWRGTPAAPDQPAGPSGKDPHSPDPKATLPDPRTMPDDVVRRMFHESGSWERLQSDLQAGTGLGHGMVAAERTALLKRFQTTREALAREVGSTFDGTVSITDSGAGRQIEVRFTGPDAAARLGQATELLDTRHPGWAAETGLVVEAGLRAVDADRISVDALNALEKATPESRRHAAELAPLYRTWRGVEPGIRLALLVEVANAELRRSGVPDVRPKLGVDNPADNGSIMPSTWELAINTELLTGDFQTPEQFAKVCDTVMHEARHALQLFRAARVNPALTKGMFDPQVWDAAQKAAANPKAESMDPTSDAYREGNAVAESIWGKGKPYRDQTMSWLKSAQRSMDADFATFEKVKPLGSGDPKRQLALENAIASHEEWKKAMDAYLNLPEEVDAWRTGLSVRAAVGERVRIEQRVTTARTQDIAANLRMIKATRAYEDALFDADKDIPAGVVREYDGARADREQTAKNLQTQVDRLAKLAPSP